MRHLISRNILTAAFLFSLAAPGTTDAVSVTDVPLGTTTIVTTTAAVGNCALLSCLTASFFDSSPNSASSGISSVSLPPGSAQASVSVAPSGTISGFAAAVREEGIENSAQAFFTLRASSKYVLVPLADQPPSTVSLSTSVPFFTRMTVAGLIGAQPQARVEQVVTMPSGPALGGNLSVRAQELSGSSGPEGALSVVLSSSPGITFRAEGQPPLTERLGVTETLGADVTFAVVRLVGSPLTTETKHNLLATFQVPVGTPFGLQLGTFGETVALINSFSANPGGTSIRLTQGPTQFDVPAGLQLEKVLSPPGSFPPLSEFPQGGKEFFSDAAKFLAKHRDAFPTDWQKIYETSWLDAKLAAAAPAIKATAEFSAFVLDDVNKVARIFSIAQAGSKVLSSATSIDRLFATGGLLYKLGGSSLTPEELVFAKRIFDGARANLQFIANPNLPSLAVAEVAFFSSHLRDAFTLLALDPPDPNFTRVAMPQTGLLRATPIEGASDPLNSLLGKLADTTDRLVAFENALNTAINRYGSALNAGDAGSAALQLGAIGSFLVTFLASVEELSATYTSIRNQLVFEGLLDGVGPIELLALQQLARERLATGLSADLLLEFASLGLTQAQVDSFLAELLSINPNSSLRDALVKALDDTTKGPDDFSAVPEPTTLLLWATTMAGLGLARWKQRRRKQEL
jgi:hypothetical protein